jgi:hypothetical protein
LLQDYLMLNWNHGTVKLLEWLHTTNITTSFDDNIDMLHHFHHVTFAGLSDAQLEQRHRQVVGVAAHHQHHLIPR